MSAVVLVVAALASCQNKGTMTSPSTPPPQSLIQATSSPEGILIVSPKAEFRLNPSGVLTASLRKDGALLSLDSKTMAAPQIVTLSDEDYSGVVLDTAKASIQDAAGKLGNLGKKIEINGNVSGTDLEETLTLEVYDDFPNLAVVSLRLRNNGQKELPLEKLIFQRHSFAADATTGEGAHPLWTFEGSSLNWGKDEIFPVPAKFSQENPFGAPVEVKGDLGHVGGGIPVVAFWSGTVGEAIGHIETLPLVVSVPVQTTKDGRVEAGVSIPAKTVLQPGDIYATPRTFLSVYSGDFYEPLKLWSDAIEKEGLSRPANNNENYAVAGVAGVTIQSYAKADDRYDPQIEGVGHPLGHSR